MPTRLRFQGEIAGVGTTSGVRVVVGRWAASPYGAFADVMVEDAHGQRTLLAPTQEVGEFVSDTYGFDDVRVLPVDVSGTERWRVLSGPLDLTLVAGSQTLLGRALGLVPRRVSGSTSFAQAVDPMARVLLRGVRTAGTAGNGRREWYSAHDVRAVEQAWGTYEGSPLGELAPVDPPVTFGFGSTPRRPCVTAVTTTVELSAR